MMARLLLGFLLPFERPEFRVFQESTGEQNNDLALKKMIASHPAAPFKLINAPEITQCFSKGRMIRISRENIDRINKEIEHDKFSDAINFMRDNDVWRSAVVRGFVKKLGLQTMDDVFLELFKSYPSCSKETRTPRKARESESRQSYGKEPSIVNENLFDRISSSRKDKEDETPWPSQSLNSQSLVPRRLMDIQKCMLKNTLLSRLVHDVGGVSYHRLPAVIAWIQQMDPNYSRSSQSLKRDHYFAHLVDMKMLAGQIKDVQNIHLAVDCTPFQNKELLQIAISYWPVNGEKPVTKVISCKDIPSKGSEDQENAVMDTFEKFNISTNKIQYITSDNAADIIGCNDGLIERLKRRTGRDIVHVPCDLYSLHNAFRVAMNNIKFEFPGVDFPDAFKANTSEYVKPVETFCQIVSHIFRKHMAKFEKALRDTCRSFTGTKCPKPLDIRWGSFANTLVWFFDNEDTILALCEFVKVNTYPFETKHRTFFVNGKYFLCLQKLLTMKDFMLFLRIISMFAQEFLIKEFQWSEGIDAELNVCGFKSHHMPERVFSRLHTLMKYIEYTEENFSVLTQDETGEIKVKVNFFLKKFAEQLWKSSNVWITSSSLLKMSLASRSPLSQCCILVLKHLQDGNVDLVASYSIDSTSFQFFCANYVQISISRKIWVGRTFLDDYLKKGKLPLDKDFIEELDKPRERVLGWFRECVRSLPHTQLRIESNFSFLTGIGHVANGQSRKTESIEGQVVNRANSRLRDIVIQGCNGANTQLSLEMCNNDIEEMWKYYLEHEEDVSDMFYKSRKIV